MTTAPLEDFLGAVRDIVQGCDSPGQCVERVAPRMRELLLSDLDFLEPSHRQDDPDHYARNAIAIEEGVLGLYALVWRPGQWTPIHDHGTWGVVGVVEGCLSERSFIRVDDGPRNATQDVHLTYGNITMLSPGTVTSFVPNPDHIHETGNGCETHPVLSLHLYGKAMSGYYEYDRRAHTRNWVDVGHQ